MRNNRTFRNIIRHEAGRSATFQLKSRRANDKVTPKSHMSTIARYAQRTSAEYFEGDKTTALYSFRKSGKILKESSGIFRTNLVYTCVTHN